MLCPHCGKEIPEKSAACPACGSELSAPRETKENPGEPREKRVLDRHADRKKRTAAAKRTIQRIGRIRVEWKNREIDQTQRKRLWYLLTFTGLGLMAAAALVLILLSGNARRTDDQPGETPPAPPAGIINFVCPVNEKTLRSSGAISYVGDELLLLPAEDCTYIEMERFCRPRGLEIVGHVELCGVYQIRLPQVYSLEELRLLASQIQQESQIELATLNAVWMPAWNALPDDPWGGNQRWDATVHGADNWGVTAIGAPFCWENYEPDPVRVGVIDSAFEARQQDMEYEELYFNDGAVSSHGTQTASIIGAIHGNGLGTAGVAENCRICGFAIPGRCSTLELMSAIAELAGEDVRVINLGQGYEDAIVMGALAGDQEILDAYYIQPAALFERGLSRLLETGRDFLLIQSAGNGLDGQSTEARWNSALSYLQDAEIRSRILVVGAAGIHDDGTYYQAPFSNGGGRVDLLAPGVDIFCAVPGGYGRVSGSSPAAAHVSGVCASVLAAKPEMSCAQVRELVVNTADIPVPEGDAPMVNMRAAMETAGAVPYKPAEDPAEDEG